MKTLTNIAIALCATALSGCSRDVSDVEFIRCWGGVLQNGVATIDFHAVLYPRNDVISANENCPDLRLKLEFHENSIPEWFHAFEIADNNPFESIGIGGRAQVTVKSRDNERMVVTVTRLIHGRILSEDEKSRIFPGRN